MSQPSIVDVTDIQFIYQNKFKVFSSVNIPKNESNLLATASPYGVIFIGTTDCHLLVCPISAIFNNNVKENEIPHLKIPLPGVPHQVALSCDSSNLAVDLEINGMTYIFIFSVPSILVNNNKVIEQIQLSQEPNVRSRSIIWNPVQNNVLAVCMDNGAMATYNLQEEGFQFHLLDKSEQAQCACWSPKGKQIVVGFPNGKLIQFKPELKAMRTISPQTTFTSPFDVISIQWLFNYQFAAVYLSREAEATPSLHIINAPKAGNPVAIKYDDVCYSSPGPRKAQVFLIHISQWNLLLVASANSMEIGILGTNEGGDTPMWNQWVTIDEARAELPLTENKEETFPVGFCLETGTTYQILKGENKMPVMPLVHILSTHGYLVSFNVVNLKQTYVDICSPPRPLSTSITWQVDRNNQNSVQKDVTVSSEISFALQSHATSTPAILDKPKSFFQPVEVAKPSTNIFGGANKSFETNENIAKPKLNVQDKNTSLFDVSKNQQTLLPGNNQSLFATPKPASQLQSILSKPTTQMGSSAMPAKLALNNNRAPEEPVTPLITVPAQYVKPKSIPEINKTTSINQPNKSSDEDNSIIRNMINEEIQNFEREFKELLNRSKTINIIIGSNDESVKMMSNLDKLQDISKQATETTDDLAGEIRLLQSSLYEAFAMTSEAKSKYDIYNQPEYLHLHDVAAKSQTSQRQLIKLQNMIQMNDVQYSKINQQMNSNWSVFEETKKRNIKNRLNIPSLEAIYQTLIKQKDILHQNKKNLNIIKTKLGMKASTLKTPENVKENYEPEMESLTDSIISMSICDQVKAENERLSNVKISMIREAINNRKVIIIKSSRPTRSGLISEVIREKKLQIQRSRKVQSNKGSSPAIQKSDIRTTITVKESANSNAIIMKPNQNKQMDLTHSGNNQQQIITTSKPLPNLVHKVPSAVIDDKPKQFSFSVGNPSVFSPQQPKPHASSDTALSFTPVQKSDATKATTAFTEFNLPKGLSIFNLNNKPSPFSTAKNDIVESKSVFASSGNQQGLEKSKSETSNLIANQPAINFSLGSVATAKSNTTSSSIFGNDTTGSKIHEHTAFGTFKPPHDDNQFKNVEETPSKTVFSKLIDLIDSVKENNPNIETKPKSDMQSITITTKPNVSMTPIQVVPALKPIQTAATLKPEPLLKNDDNIVAVSTVANTTITTPSFVNIFSSATSITPINTPASSFSFGNAFAETKEITTSIAPQDTVENALQGFNICKPNEGETAGQAQKSENIFAIAAATIPAVTTSSIFGSMQIAKPLESIQTTAPVTIPTTSSLFGGTNATVPADTLTSSPQTGNIFGTNTNTFVSPNNGSVFGNVSVKPESGNIFGANAAFGATPTESVFGVKSTEASSVFATTEEKASMFGSTIPDKTTTPFGSGSSVFGSPAPVGQFSSGSSIFGQPTSPSSVFGTSPATTSIFGTPNNTNSQSGGSLFGTGFGTATSPSSGSIFGGSNAIPSTGFGGFSQQTGSTFGSPGFGQQSPSITSPTINSPFAQTQPTFGSPPAFGGAAAFGGSPTFGGQATFGAAPTFGGGATFSSPTKSAFGNVFSNMNTQQQPSFTAAAPQNSLFEQLGSSDNAMTFGNLAQSASANQAKPQFGGSAFSSWR